jgi:hypothetical protein
LGKPYQAALEVAGCTVLVRYDPYQPDRVQVWSEGRRYRFICLADSRLTQRSLLRPCVLPAQGPAGL